MAKLRELVIVELVFIVAAGWFFYQGMGDESTTNVMTNVGWLFVALTIVLPIIYAINPRRRMF